MKTNTNTASQELAEPVQNLVDDARELLNATVHVTGEKVAEARRRLNVAMEKGKDALQAVQKSAVSGARATDRTIRKHPYQSIGIALGVGVVLGLYLRRRG